MKTHKLVSNTSQHHEPAPAALTPSADMLHTSSLLYSPPSLDCSVRDNSLCRTTHMAQPHIITALESNLSKPFLLTLDHDSPSGEELNGIYYAVFYSSITL